MQRTIEKNSSWKIGRKIASLNEEQQQKCLKQHCGEHITSLVNHIKVLVLLSSSSFDYILISQYEWQKKTRQNT